MTLNLSEAKNGCRPHLRGSVRRASGFVLTGKAEGIPKLALMSGLRPGDSISAARSECPMESNLPLRLENLPRGPELVSG